MTNTLRVERGVSFHFDEIRGYVTDHVFTDGGDLVVFARAWWQFDEDESSPGQMAAVTMRDRSITVGADQAAASWQWISRDDFDRIVGMDEMRKSMGWR